jgi:hypothetical protein
MEDFYLSNKSNTYYLALVGILMSIVLIVKAIFNFVIVLNGYPLDFYIVFYVLGMMLINKRSYAWTFALLTPWLLLIIPSGAVNILDILLEYICSLYIFCGFIYFDKISTVIGRYFKNKKTCVILQICVFTLMLLICFCTKLLIHVFAGVIWYIGDHNLSNLHNWYAAFALNFVIIIVNFSINLPIGVMLYPSLVKFQDSTNLV